MEQAHLEASKPDALKPVYHENIEAKLIFGPKKKKKANGKNFLQQLLDTLSCVSAKQASTLKTGSLPNQPKKSLEKANLQCQNIIIAEKKKPHRQKTLESGGNVSDTNLKSEKPKDNKKKTRGRLEEQLNQAAIDASDKPKEEKKSVPDTRQTIEPGLKERQNNLRENSDKSKRTIVIDLRKTEDANLKSWNTQSSDEASLKAEAQVVFQQGSAKGGDNAYLGTGFSGQESGFKTKNSEGKSKSLLSSESFKTFQDILHNELITSTRFVIRDGGGGEIEIQLRPESLGKLKFKVSLENNRIEGKIFVENSNVREMVEQSMQNLQTALLDEGFDSVNLQVSLGGEGSHEERQYNGFSGSDRRALDFEKGAATIDYFDGEDRLVNLVI